MRMRAKYVDVVTASSNGVAERWAEHYQHPIDGWRASPLSGGRLAVDVYKKLCGLGANPSADKVAEIIGNKSWSHVSCDGCPEYVERAVRIGDHEGKVYCETCLSEALHALKA